MTKHFPLGTVVAYVTSHPRGNRSIFKATVNKVRKDDKFFVSWTRKDPHGADEIVKSDTMWTPIGSRPEARQSGRDSSYTRASLEVWTAKHDRELRDIRDASMMDRNRTRVKEAIDELKPHLEGDRRILASLWILLKDRNLPNDDSTD